jgi:hypothetical protein
VTLHSFTLVTGRSLERGAMTPWAASVCDCGWVGPRRTEEEQADTYRAMLDYSDHVSP